MAVAHRATSFATGTTGAVNGSAVGTEPAGAASGDYLVAFALFDAVGTTSFTPPAGWTVLKSGATVNTKVDYAICGIVRGGAAPSYTFTSVSSAGRYWEVHVSAFSGAHATQPDSQAAAVAGGSGSRANVVDPPSTTAVSSAAMAVALGLHWAGSGAGWTAPTGYTRVSDNTNGNDGMVAVKLLSASGAENPGVFTDGSATTDDWMAHTITVAPAATGQSFTLTPATETDVAQALVFTKPIRVTLTPATETDGAQALSITHPIIVTLTPAVETDAANPIAAAHVIPLTPANETDTPVAITMAKSVSMTPAVETDAAQALSFTKPIKMTLTPAVETDTAQVITFFSAGGQRITLTPATETDTAVPLVFSVVGGGAAARKRYYVQRTGHSVRRRAR